MAESNMQFGIAVSSGFEKVDPKKAVDEREKVAAVHRAALDRSISLAQQSLQKQIAEIQKTDTAIQDRAQAATDRLREIEQKAQAAAQRFLAAGPSPFEQNADLYYDPKKRLLFAEQIAGNTDSLLQQQADAAKASAEASAAQIAALEAQAAELDSQAELLAAGVDLSQQELDRIDVLIDAVRTELPANLASAFDRIQTASEGQVTKGLLELPKTAGGTAPIDASFRPGLGIQYNYGVAPPGSRTISGMASGGEFTVPGSYSSGDRPFMLGLAGQERVTVETPGQQAAKPRGAAGTTIERMIVQLPPGSDPIALMNKTSRTSLSRAARGMGRAV